MSVIPGLERLADLCPALLRGARTGLMTHPAAVGRDYAPALSWVQRAGALVDRLFAPEHGLGGMAQDMIAVDEQRDPLSGLPVISLYGKSEASLTPRPEDFAGLDLLVIDLCDVGARYYTFAASAIRALPVAGASGVRVLIADRPNPLNGLTIEGNLIDPGFHSFVGELSVPNRHGLTIGELCRLACRQRGLDLDLTIVAALGWDRSAFWDETGLPWIHPSPNMPTLDTAVAYPGLCLIEGTNLSEARGTTKPFELFGAPWLHPEALAQRLSRFSLPGVLFRPLHFRPAFHKFAGLDCGGVQLHVTDRRLFRPVLTGLAVIAAARELAPDHFRWRTEAYEFVSDRLAFDLLAGGPSWRQALESGASPWDIAADWPQVETEFARLLQDFGIATRIDP